MAADKKSFFSLFLGERQIDDATEAATVRFKTKNKFYPMLKQIMTIILL